MYINTSEYSYGLQLILQKLSHLKMNPQSSSSLNCKPLQYNDIRVVRGKTGHFLDFAAFGQNVLYIDVTFLYKIDRKYFLPDHGGRKRTTDPFYPAWS
jgi:hypothetical protein